MTKVLIETTKGNIVLQLNAEKAPITVENFLTYVKEGFYNNTIFHRVIKDFMIQGGGFNTDFVQKETHSQIKNEAQNGLKNKRGTIAMARTMVVDSATSQFFINHKDNDFLDFKSPDTYGFGYCVFGEVVEGLDVVDAIAEVKTGNKQGHQDVPVENVVMTKVSVID